HHGVDADEALVDDPGTRREPKVLGGARTGEQHRGRAVGDLRRRARGVDAVLARDGLQGRELLERRVTEPLVALDAVRGAERVAVVVDVGRVDYDDLTVEALLPPCARRAHLRFETEMVAVAPSDAPLVGDPLR